MQLDATTGSRWVHWIVFSKDGLYKSESKELAIAGAPAIETPPTLLDAVVGQVRSGQARIAWAARQGGIVSFATVQQWQRWQEWWLCVLLHTQGA